MSVRHASRLQDNAVLIPGRPGIRLQAFATRLIPRAIMATLGEQGSRKVPIAGRS